MKTTFIAVNICILITAAAGAIRGATAVLSTSPDEDTVPRGKTK